MEAKLHNEENAELLIKKSSGFEIDSAQLEVLLANSKNNYNEIEHGKEQRNNAQYLKKLPKWCFESLKRSRKV